MKFSMQCIVCQPKVRVYITLKAYVYTRAESFQTGYAEPKGKANGNFGAILGVPKSCRWKLIWNSESESMVSSPLKLKHLVV